MFGVVDGRQPQTINRKLQNQKLEDQRHIGYIGKLGERQPLRQRVRVHHAKRQVGVRSRQRMGRHHAG